MDVTTDLPIPQIMIFDIGKEEAFYLDRLDSSDENNMNNPQSVYLRQITKRVMPILLAKQGEGGLATVDVQMLNYGNKLDLTGWHGDSLEQIQQVFQSQLIIILIPKIQHRLISFSLPKEATIHAGDYRNAYFKFRDKNLNVVKTLFFNVRILEDSNYYPDELPHKEYWGEGERALYELGQLQKSYTDLIMNNIQNLDDIVLAKLSDYNNRMSVIEEAIKNNDFTKAIQTALNSDFDIGQVDPDIEKHWQYIESELEAN
jgi:hypothetical protein